MSKFYKSLTQFIISLTQS